MFTVCVLLVYFHTFAARESNRDKKKCEYVFKNVERVKPFFFFCVYILVSRVCVCVCLPVCLSVFVSVYT